MKKRQEIKLMWSKKENDWIFKYTDNAGKSMTGVFFDMIKTTGHRVDWQESLIKMLSDRGFDYRTFTMKCSKS